MASPTRKQGKATRAVFIHSPELETYSYPPDCPFNSSRAGMLRKSLLSMGLLSTHDQREVVPVSASRTDLLEFHTARYLDAMQAAQEGRLGPEGLRMGLGTPDNPVFKGMYEYAALVCGASLAAADILLAGEADVAFNPSGGLHHAMPEKASGFCYLNDVVLACMRLAGAKKRVAYVDVDAHHGDGVQQAFYERSDVMTMSFHESGRTLFPGTGFEDDIGVGAGTGYSANVPLPAGVHDAAYLRAFHAVAGPLIGAFAPDVIVMELGMDALAGDPLTHMELTNNAHAEVVAQLLRLGKPLLVTGGGGYNLDNTVRGWALAWSMFCGEDDASAAMSLGVGGVLLENTDWRGGLRDRARAPERLRTKEIDAVVDATIEKVKSNLFAYHGL